MESLELVMGLLSGCVQQDAREKDRQAEEMMRQMETEYEAELAAIKVGGYSLPPCVPLLPSLPPPPHCLLLGSIPKQAL